MIIPNSINRAPSSNPPEPAGTHESMDWYSAALFHSSLVLSSHNLGTVDMSASTDVVDEFPMQALDCEISIPSEYNTEI